jgi:hypothetical protein
MPDHRIEGVGEVKQLRFELHIAGERIAERNREIELSLRHLADVLDVSDRGHPKAEAFLRSHGWRFDQVERRWSSS